jgi:hypothetical protein
MATGSVLVQGDLVAILSSNLPFTLELSALRRMSARSFSILMSIEPAAAALCGLIFPGERLELTEWIAIVLIASASAGAALTARVKQERESFDQWPAGSRFVFRYRESKKNGHSRAVTVDAFASKGIYFL